MQKEPTPYKLEGGCSRVHLNDVSSDRLLNPATTIAQCTDDELMTQLFLAQGRHLPQERTDALLTELDKISMGSELAALPGLKSLECLAPESAVLRAAYELVRRRLGGVGCKIRQVEDVIPLVRHYASRKQEHVICLSLNGAYEVLAVRLVTVGLANCCQIHPREIFADPIVDRACAVIVAHNHPSGDLTPSKEDREVTDRLSKAGKILGIKLLDHVVFASQGGRSIME